MGVRVSLAMAGDAGAAIVALKHLFLRRRVSKPI
jgi:hypothetical protein